MTPSPDLTVAETLRLLGGHARAEDLRERVGRARLIRATRHADIVRVGRGHYALPELPPASLAAGRAGGAVSHGTAARHWGLALLVPPAEVHVTVPHGARPLAAEGVRYHWSTVPPDEVTDGVTTPLRTVLDCATAMPFREGLALADSALRADLVGEEELHEAATRRRGPGSRRCRRVIEHAVPDAANPFESAVRAITLTAGLTGFVPQLEIATRSGRAQVDLADPRLRLVLEGDSYTHHGSRGAFARDCRRYDELVREGWTVLRFTWEHVLFHPEWVTAVVSDVAATLAHGTRATRLTVRP